MKRALVGFLAVSLAAACGADENEDDDTSNTQSPVTQAEAGVVLEAGTPATPGTSVPNNSQQPTTLSDAAVDAAPTGTPTTPVMTSGEGPRIPAKPSQCPSIKTGNVTVLGQSVQLWVGAKQAGKKGPVMFYWHGTGSNSGEATSMLGDARQAILNEGGVIASFTTTTKKGTNTGNNVWYTGDFEMADQLLACAIEQQDVDPRRVYTAGCSAGGLQASAMVYQRSSYLAAAAPNSGGIIQGLGFGAMPPLYGLENPKRVPAVIPTHGAAGKDVVGIDFSTTTAAFVKDIAAKGGFAVQCDHGGGHCASPPAVKTAQWQFLLAHPFGVAPEPYASGLPGSFPTFCKIIPK